MRHVLSFILLLVLEPALAQQAKPLRSDIRDLLQLLPNGPASTADARLNCADGESSDHGPDKVMAPFRKAMENTQTARLGGTGPNASQEAMMQKMQDPAFQEQMKRMSPQEIAQLMQQVQGGTLPMSGPVTDEEGALAEEFERLNGDQMTFDAGFHDQWTALRSELDNKRAAEHAVLEKEVAACPMIVMGETNERDHQCEVAANKRYVHRMEAVLNAWLPKANALIDRYRADVIARYAQAQERLIALDYGNKCGTQMFLDMVVNTQTLMLGSLESVGQLRTQVWSTACQEKEWMDGMMKE